ncbi:Mdm33 family-domain-containing protein [Truncatella angustata]|uniref:Sensitive to high expression protein 9, mitochondrial n=1 Tax=Truncatella angustata TaxID=152316 RepID=A0A9P8UXN0_9PEZI|nr:Mdm33 family-domain-containing protein [Truncatella angustata]KAH6660431.1 Mdm33 family-domain-containing protein [Truncatella angustata]KAH8202543.1 hypothetical protein TruAng_003254 [Truncatella angustata]
MPPSGILRPILGASSRLLRGQCFNDTASASPRRLAAAAFRASAAKSPVCPSCSVYVGRQLRFYSAKPPSEPPNFDHLRPEEKLDQHPNFDHLRPVEERPAEPTSSTSRSESGPTINLPPPDSTPETSTKPSPADSNPQDATADPSSLPSHSESQRSEISAAFSSFMDRMQTQLFQASQRINDLTGYSGIETLKNQISNLESALTQAQENLHSSRNAYKVSVSERSSSQREVTTLLARQKSWTPADFERFTALYRTDYELEAAVARHASELEEAEREAERLSRELSAGILARYHEEQIWSDKIRRMSTWGTWGLMGVNILLFFMFQFGAEPWRRARLVKGFEEKVQEALERERLKEKAERIEVLGAFFGQSQTANGSPAAATVPDESAQAAAVAEAIPAENMGSAVEKNSGEVKSEVPTEVSVIAEDIPAAAEGKPSSTWQEVLTSTAWWKDTWADLTSEKEVSIRMRDVSLLVLEGTAAGAAIASTIAIFFLRRT